jgi:hypothetical protein
MTTNLLTMNRIGAEPVIDARPLGSPDSEPLSWEAF